MPHFAKTTGALALGVALSLAAAAMAQSPSSALDPGHGRQTWQNPGYARLVARCKTPPKAFGIPISKMTQPPPLEFPPPSAAIPGVIAAGQSWKTVWAWEGNNVDGPIAWANGSILVGNNDAGNVMRIDPATGRAKILYTSNTAGAVSRSKNGALFVAERGLPEAIVRLEPSRKLLAKSFHGEPLECTGGVINDLSADAHGGVYIAISGGGLLYADPAGVVSQYGDAMGGANGIILSPDEKQLYVGNGMVVDVFDVQADGALTGQREFAKLHTGRVADGSTVDSQGRLYVATGAAVDVFSSTGEFLGSIAGPPGIHGVAFGGKDKRTLYGIVFYGGWGSPAARNQLIAIPVQAQGYLGRAK
ncbi:MAG TPA: SMP-30/gluconolactonase/LRE family protein [Caulobacteraceae bacterium]